MTMSVPRPLHGIITDTGGSPINNAKVYVKDSTNDQGTTSVQTDASGRYIVNIQEYATNTDTVSVWCFSSGNYKIDTVAVNLSNPPERVDLQMEDFIIVQI